MHNNYSPQLEGSIMKTPTVKGTNYDLHLGDNWETLKTYPDNYFDSIVTDPPYGIEFLGKEWDSHTGTLDLYKECLRVLKPGGYMLAFSAARTYHQLASNIELAGFEIRDQLFWLYSSGFPKAQDIGKALQKRGVPGDEYHGWKTSLKPAAEPLVLARKPAHEPIVMARKPFKGSTIDNVLKNGLGAMNIDATRVPWADDNSDAGVLKRMEDDPLWAHGDKVSMSNILAEATGAERIKRKKSDPLEEALQVAIESAKEINLILDKADARTKKKKSDREKRIEVAQRSCPTAGHDNKFNFDGERGGYEHIPSEEDIEKIAAGRYPSNVIGDMNNESIQKYFYNPSYDPAEIIPEVQDGYARFKYCPKVSRKERHVGFDDSETLPEMIESVGGKVINEQDFWLPGVGNIKMHGAKHEVEKIRKAQGITATNIGNDHPTVKPVALMDYLIKLVTPPSTPTLQRKVLDPFMGSGSTGMAATALGHHFTGCELDPKYVAIAQTRIEAWNK